MIARWYNAGQAAVKPILNVACPLTCESLALSNERRVLGFGAMPQAVSDTKNPGDSTPGFFNSSS